MEKLIERKKRQEEKKSNKGDNQKKETLVKSTKTNKPIEVGDKVRLKSNGFIGEISQIGKD